jgi:hypothetical protein
VRRSPGVEDEQGRGRIVPAVTLNEVLHPEDYGACTLICDIEGSEVDLVEHESDVLGDRVAMLVMEEHPEFVDSRRRALMFDRLERIGFRRLEQLRKVHVLVNTNGLPASPP